MPDLVTLLDGYHPQGDTETADIHRVRTLTETAADPYRRDLPLHVTASALIVHPPTARVLLRWHQRQQAWLQVGGHGDPGETDPLAIVSREAREDRPARPGAVAGRRDQARGHRQRPAGQGRARAPARRRPLLMATQAPDGIRPEARTPRSAGSLSPMPAT